MTNLRNKVQLIGNLGKPVEYKKLDSGKTFSRVSIATKDIYKNKSGEKIVDTQWHNLVGWDRIADNMEMLMKKGKKVAVEGKLQHRTYEDKDGTKRYVSEILVQEFELLS